MPRNINLNTPKVSAGTFSTPPPASPVGTIRGVVPRPTGTAIKFNSKTVPDEQYLTPQERKDLSALGLGKGDPLPEGLAAEIKKAKEEANKIPLPVAPDTPPLAVKTVQISDLPEARRREIVEKAVAGAAALRSVTAKANTPQSMGRFEVVNDLDDEIDVAEMPEADPTLQMAAVVAARAAYADPTPPEEPTDEPSQTGIETPMHECPHCKWPLNMVDDANPTAEDEEAYLQAMCGDIPFVREYPLYNGRASVAFRSLTQAEVDAVYKQANTEAKEDATLTVKDFYERVARLRFYLQLQHLRMPQDFRELPDGLSPETNPGATGFWGTDPDEPPLPQIEKFVLTQFVRQEPLVQLLAAVGQRFNRLVGALQIRAATADFIHPTE